MAKKDKIDVEKQVSDDRIDDVSDELVKQINREFGNRIAYNLAVDDAPTNVKRWLSTGSLQLDYLIRNATGGGYPEGRIIEISGTPSSGKSHLAIACAVNVQKMGGLIVYIDTENATMLDKLIDMGLNVKKQFVYCETSCTEEVFQIIESTITKAKAILAKNVPILVVWDSVAATSPKAELEGDYDQTTMGLQARTISKCMRKITGVLGQNNVTLLCLNQVRDAIGVLHGDPLVSPGGKAIPFHSSVRIRLGSGNQVKDKGGNVVGSHVTVSIKKNKVAPPFRKCMFDIIFGKGIVENDYIFDEVRLHCKEKGPIKHDGHSIMISGDGAWKELIISSETTGEVSFQKKFYKAEFSDLLKDNDCSKHVYAAIETAYVTKASYDAAEVGEEEVTSDE